MQTKLESARDQDMAHVKTLGRGAQPSNGYCSYLQAWVCRVGNSKYHPVPTCERSSIHLLNLQSIPIRQRFLDVIRGGYACYIFSSVGSNVGWFWQHSTSAPVKGRSWDMETECKEHALQISVYPSTCAMKLSTKLVAFPLPTVVLQATSFTERKGLIMMQLMSSLVPRP